MIKVTIVEDLLVDREPIGAAFLPLLHRLFFRFDFVVIVIGLDKEFGWKVGLMQMSNLSGTLSYRICIRNTSQTVHRFVSLCVCLFMYLSIHPLAISLSLSIRLSVCLSSVDLPVCSITISIYLSVDLPACSNTISPWQWRH